MTNAPVPDLKQLIATEAGLQEVYAIFVLLTLPDFPATDAVPAAQADDPQFRVVQDGSATTTTAATINFKLWNNDNQSARLNGSWFINKYKEDNLDQERWALRVEYLNWRGEPWSAARTGAGFVHTKFDDPTQTFESAEIKYLDANGNKFTASLVLANLEIAVLPVVATRDGYSDRSPRTRPVAIVNSDGQAPDTLSISVNNGASATVTGVTISNLRVDAAGRVTADLLADCASSPPTFNLRVTDKVGQSKTTPLLVRLSPVEYGDETGNTLASTLPAGVVGTSYQGFLTSIIFITTCSLDQGVTFDVTSGRLPPGLSFGGLEECTIVPPGIERCTTFGNGIVGTPTTGGIFKFTLKMTFGNGDSFSRDYTVNIASSPVPLSGDAFSWWSGERGLLDDLNINPGRAVGNFNNASFAPGKVGLAFSFKGDNSAVQLPDDFYPFNTASTFRPFTFETWFKTATSGVIIGQQNTNPFDSTSLSYYTPGIYVGTDGLLRVQMFYTGSVNPMTSASPVNDDSFHHVAVVYDGARQVVYLDGVEMGSITHDQRSVPTSFKYQFGTGYTQGWPASNDSWFNFNGLVDEPTLYDNPLTAEEVQAIYAAGSAGKLLITATPFNPICAGDLTGVILAKVLGNGAPYSFSPYLNPAIDGAPISESVSEGVFSNLQAGDYTVKIRDVLGREFSRVVTLTDPPPISLTPAALAPVNPGQRFAQNFQASGGSGNITLTLSGALPPGLTFTNYALSSSATLTGTPTQSGSFPITITAEGAGGCSTSQFGYTLVINAINTPPVVTPAPPITRQQGATGTTSIIATVSDDLTPAGSLTVAATNVPAGISVTGLVNTDGTITADVAAACAAALGAQTIGLKVTDGSNLTATASLTVNVTPGVCLRDFAVFSRELTELRANARVVTGSVGSNASLPDPNGGTDDAAEIILGANAQVQQSTSRVVGDTIRLGANASIFNTGYNELYLGPNSRVLGARSTPLALPVAILPALPAITPGTEDITVNANQTETLAPGSYRTITVKPNGKLLLTGGLYQFTSLNVQPNAEVRFQAAGELRIKQQMMSSPNAFIGPAGSGVTAQQVVIYVEGADSGGRLAAELGGTVQANIYAAQGTLALRPNTKAVGAFIGWRVIVGVNVEVRLLSAF